MNSKVSRVLRTVAWWVLRHVRPTEDDIDRALREAFMDAGVSLDHFTHDYDPGAKRLEILHHAAVRLGNPLYTIEDLRRLLR